MRSLQLSALALAAAQTVHSYVDTSPFFMFSTSELLNSAKKLSSADVITSEIAATLSTCPSDYYIIISQPGVTASDYSSHRTAPALAQRLSSTKPHHHIRSSKSIPDVVGQIDTDQWRQTLKAHCDVEVVDLDATTGSLDLNTPWSKAVMVTMAAPSTATLSDDLFRNDLILSSILDLLPRTSRGSNYTVLYTTIPGEKTVRAEPIGGYAMDSEAQELLHMEMKRDLGSRAPKIVGNQTIIDGPLFEKYQFFTPGIFMGGLVSLLLLSILYVGLSALSSLSVTYAAFDKDQGQLAKTKAQ